MAGFANLHIAPHSMNCQRRPDPPEIRPGKLQPTNKGIGYDEYGRLEQFTGNGHLGGGDIVSGGVGPGHLIFESEQM